MTARYNDKYNRMEYVEIFPGSVSEYERFKGYEVEILGDSEPVNKGVVVDEMARIKLGDWNRWLINSGVEAIVNATVSSLSEDSGKYYYGLPVKRKKSGEAQK